ncbi:MAG: leucine--tRNA ligase, partial [Planctomycetaceae bacterium]|nr:leucine--tRNA ligase [Planctomycetaceae bacterium]
SDFDRGELNKDKTGVFTGSFAINPVNNAEIPIWIADYVLMSYGTGSIMAVPGHDERDFDFAKKFELPIIEVVEGGNLEKAAFTGKKGKIINSSNEDGLDLNHIEVKDAIEKAIVWLESKSLGKRKIQYKLKDWLFSRQRYWGEPIPIIHSNDQIIPLDESDLPLNLPEVDMYEPSETGESPLANIPEWLNTEKGRRETNTMPQWAGSCWYYLRFLDPTNHEQFIDPEIENAWMPVDLYVGGAEHAVLHLLYSRFWHKVLYDRGYVSAVEPFARLVNQGMILGEVEFTGYRGSSGGWVSAGQQSGSDTPIKIAAENVEKHGEHFVLRDAPEVRVESRAYKMSKSRGNVVNPDKIVREFGADALRLYEMFMGPLEATKPWSTSGVGGVRSFLDRCWRLVVDEGAEDIQLAPQVTDKEPTDEQMRVAHRMLDKVTSDIESLSFNTAIAKMMEFVNFATPLQERPREMLSLFVSVLSPFAPHLAEELWIVLGNKSPVSLAAWPPVDERWLQDDILEIPVQVQGKLRARITVATGTDAAGLEAAAVAEPKIAAILAGKTVVKVVAVPGRMVNFVLKK